MIGDTIRLTATRRSSICRTLLILGGIVIFLALSPARVETATTFTVNRTGDEADMDLTDGRCDASITADDQCTLRAAIEEANDTTGADNIDFDIGGTTTAKIISPTTALPIITDSVVIDGYTQPGTSPNPLTKGNDADLRIVLDGLDAGADVGGLRFEAADCTIKGFVIRRFDDYGLSISGAADNTVEGNFIGVGRDGITDRGNIDGVYVRGDSNVIGGTDPASRNVVSGNDSNGVSFGYGSEDNRIEGNFIGTTADGAASLGNGSAGIVVSGAADNTIGGTVAGARNVISSNESYGVYVFGAVSTGNRIEGNFIGTTANVRGALGNDAAGVFLLSTDLTTVGGTSEGAGNRIAHNGADGVAIGLDDPAGNHILSNSIYNNAERGIDLVGGTENASGVTSNDAADSDTGPNGLQNFPVIRSATRSSSTYTTTISGRLHSNPSQDFVIQCFLSNRMDASGHGEGSRLLGTTTASTNTAGNARFSCVLPLFGQILGQTVSATATNIVTGDSSEFSKSKAITASP
jgi:hypothetical protein